MAEDLHSYVVPVTQQFVWDVRLRTAAGCFLPLDISAFASGGGGSWEEVQTEPATGGALQVPIQVRSERDPFLYFLDISGGTKNFGLTTGEKVRPRFVVVVIPAPQYGLPIQKFRIAGSNFQRPDEL